MRSTRPRTSSGTASNRSPPRTTRRAPRVACVRAARRRSASSLMSVAMTRASGRFDRDRERDRAGSRPDVDDDRLPESPRSARARRRRASSVSGRGTSTPGPARELESVEPSRAFDVGERLAALRVGRGSVRARHADGSSRTSPRARHEIAPSQSERMRGDPLRIVHAATPRRPAAKPRRCGMSATATEFAKANWP